MTTEPVADVSAEKALLGTCLFYDQVLTALTMGLSREDFYRDAHRVVWDAAVSVAQDGVPPDLMTVGQRLRERGQWDEVGPAYYTTLVDGAVRPTPDGLRYQVSRLQQYRSAREVMRICGALAHEIATHPRSVSALVQQSVSDLDAVTTPIRQDQQPLDGMGQMAALLADLQRDPGEAVRWGFAGLDQQIPGMYAGEVCGLMARPAVGKTLFLGHMARRLAAQGLGHVVVSLEMPAAQIAARVARAVYGYSRQQLEDHARGGTLDPTHYTEATHGLWLVDAPGLSVAQIDGQLRALAGGPMRGCGIRVVTIDHLGLIGGDRRMSTYDRVSTQARELKELAKRHNVLVLLAVQVNREQGGDGSRELTLGAARDSGVVEEAMDYLVALRRLDRNRELSQESRLKFRDAIFLRVLKNRHGQLGDEIAIRLNGQDLTLAEDPYLHAEEGELRDLLSRSRGRR